jgi:hypothetical protein
MMEALCTTRTGMPARRARSSRSVCVVALQKSVGLRKDLFRIPQFLTLPQFFLSL